MTKKQITIFAIALLSFVAIGFITITNKESKIKNEIYEANFKQIKDVKFFKDYLRADTGLDLPIKDKKDVENFLNALKTIKPTSYSIKSLNIIAVFTIQLVIKVEKERFLTIRIYESDETDGLGIISIDENKGSISSSGGTYESKELLEWIKKMEQKDGYEKIGEYYKN